jgi:hypothetical protein
MQQPYQQLIELLGKPRPASAELLLRLIQDLEEKPVVDCTHDRIWLYDFPQCGISLVFDTNTGMFWSLSLYIATRQVKAGAIGPYEGNLPYGITRNDSRETVEVKLPGGTMAVKDYRTDVDLRPLVLTFHFQAPDPDAPGIGEERLIMASASYLATALRGLSWEAAS